MATFLGESLLWWENMTSLDPDSCAYISRKKLINNIQESLYVYLSVLFGVFLNNRCLNQVTDVFYAASC